MKAQKIFKMIFGFHPNGEEQETTFQIVNSETLLIQCRGMEREVFYDEENIYDADGNFLFFIQDLECLGNFEEWNVCPDCNDEGYTLEFVGCSRPASDCCGGCDTEVKCECEDKPFKFD